MVGVLVETWIFVLVLRRETEKKPFLFLLDISTIVQNFVLVVVFADD